MTDRISDPLLLQAALIGLRQMHAGYELRIAELRRAIGTGPAPENKPKQARKRKRTLSAEGRANIVAALKKRWANRHKEEAQAQAKPNPKTVPSRKAIGKVASKKGTAKKKAVRKPASKKVSEQAPAPAAATENAAPDNKA